MDHHSSDLQVNDTVKTNKVSSNAFEVDVKKARDSRHSTSSHSSPLKVVRPSSESQYSSSARAQQQMEIISSDHPPNITDFFYDMSFAAQQAPMIEQQMVPSVHTFSTVRHSIDGPSFVSPIDRANSLQLWPSHTIHRVTSEPYTPSVRSAWDGLTPPYSDDDLSATGGSQPSVSHGASSPQEDFLRESVVSAFGHHSWQVLQPTTDGSQLQDDYDDDSDLASVLHPAEHNRPHQHDPKPTSLPTTDGSQQPSDFDDLDQLAPSLLYEEHRRRQHYDLRPLTGTTMPHHISYHTTDQRTTDEASAERAAKATAEAISSDETSISSSDIRYRQRDHQRNRHRQPSTVQSRRHAKRHAHEQARSNREKELRAQRDAQAYFESMCPSPVHLRRSSTAQQRNASLDAQPTSPIISREKKSGDSRTLPPTLPPMSQHSVEPKPESITLAEVAHLFNAFLLKALAGNILSPTLLPIIKPTSSIIQSQSEPITLEKVEHMFNDFLSTAMANSTSSPPSPLVVKSEPPSAQSTVASARRRPTWFPNRVGTAEEIELMEGIPPPYEQNRSISSRISFKDHGKWRVDKLVPFLFSPTGVFWKDFMSMVLAAACHAYLPHSFLIGMFRSSFLYDPATFTTLNNHFMATERMYEGRELPLAYQPAPDFENWDLSTTILCEYLLLLTRRFNRVESTEGVHRKIDNVYLAEPNFCGLQLTYDTILALYYRLPLAQQRTVNLQRKLYNAIRKVPVDMSEDSQSERGVDLCRKFEVEFKAQRLLQPGQPITDILNTVVLLLTEEHQSFYDDIS